MRTRSLIMTGMIILSMLGVHFQGALAQEVKTEETEETLPFSDVNEMNRYYDAVNFAYENGWVEGYEDGTFKPYKEINRAEALKVILVAFDRVDLEEDLVEEVAEESTEEVIEENESDDFIETEEINPFPDVKEEDWFFEPIFTAYQMEIVGGYPDGKFYPEKTVNLAESIKMIIESGGIFDEPYVQATLTENPAPDVSIDEWFANYAYYAFENALIYLEKDGNLNAHNPVTRGELLDIIYRLKNPGIYSAEVEYGIASYYGKSFDGSNTASGQTLYNDDYVAAHKTLPFDTIVRVTNVNTGDTIEVRIIDRGPYTEGRTLDLSYGAFEALADPSAGLIVVESEIVYK